MSRMTPYLAACLMVAAPAWAQKPTMRLCSGPDKGNYQNAAHEVVKQGKDRIDFSVIDTKGSVDNLDKLASGECDAAPVQNDAFRVYKQKYQKDAGSLERAGPLYREYVHLICNRKSNISRVTDLRDGKVTVAIGPSGSGSSVTWDSFVLADKSYEKTPTSPLAGLRALEKVKIGDEIGCMLWTSALNSGFMQGDVTKASEYVHLVKANDGDFANAKDEKGTPIYQYVDIPGGTYGKIQDGSFSSSVATVAVDAIWVVRTAFIDKNERQYNWFLEAKNKATPAIKHSVNQ